MNLIVNQMMQLQIVHVTDRYRTVKELSGTSVSQPHLTVSGNGNTLPQGSVIPVFIQILHNFRIQNILIFRTEFFKIFCIHIIVGQLQGILNIILVGAVKYRRGNIESQRLGCQTQMDLQNLSDVHTGRHAQRVQHDIQRTAVGRKGISSTGSTRETTPLFP